MLEYATLLHDIGQHVSRKGHHRHAAYLIDHAQLRGFSPGEIEFLAALVRHHRRGDIKASEPRAAALDKDARERLRKLAALLRLADGLDRGRRAIVTDVDVEIGTDLVVLRLHTRDNAELELWGVRRRRDLFEKVFERELEAMVAAASPVARPSSTSEARSGRTQTERPNRPGFPFAHGAGAIIPRIRRRHSCTTRDRARGES